jgi:hypothetical protein
VLGEPAERSAGSRPVDLTLWWKYTTGSRVVGRVNDACAIGPPARALSSVGLADPGAAHEHDDEQRLVGVERVRLPAEVVGETFEFGPLNHGERKPAAAVEPRAAAAVSSPRSSGARVRRAAAAASGERGLEFRCVVADSGSVLPREGERERSSVPRWGQWPASF